MGKVPLWDLFSNKKAQVKKNQCQKKSKKKINSISPNQMLPIPSKNNAYIATFRLKVGKNVKVWFKDNVKKCYF